MALRELSDFVNLIFFFVFLAVVGAKYVSNGKQGWWVGGIWDVENLVGRLRSQSFRRADGPLSLLQSISCRANGTGPSIALAYVICEIRSDLTRCAGGQSVIPPIGILFNQVFNNCFFDSGTVVVVVSGKKLVTVLMQKKVVSSHLFFSSPIGSVIFLQNPPFHVSLLPIYIMHNSTIKGSLASFFQPTP